MSVRRTLMHGVLAVGLSLLLASALTYILQLEQQRDRARDQLQLGSQAGELRAQLLNELNSTLYLASGLVSYLQGKNGQISRDEVQPWLQNMINQTLMIRAIAIAPDNRINIIYPTQGNEAAIGLYYPDVPGQWPAVEQAILSRSPVLTGPVHLKQGGEALIYRTPVFLPDSRYWGMVSTVLNLAPLLDQAKILAKENSLIVSLTSQPKADNPHFMLGDLSSMSSASVRLEIALPGSQWLMGVSRAKQDTDGTSMTFLHGLSLSISVLLGILVWLMLRAAERRNLAQSAFLLSRQRFTQAFETAPQGIALITPEGRWIEVNAKLCELLGRDSQTVQSTDLWQVLPSDQQDKVREQLLEAHHHPQQWESCILDNQDQPIDCHFSAAWLPGDAPSLILQCQDIRESKRLIRLKNEFVSTVSHELRTPLTSIAGALDLVTGGVLGEVPQPMRSMLEIARQNSQRLSLLINDLLDMEKLNAGKVRVELSSQSLRELLQDAIASNSCYAEPLGVSYRLQESTDVHVGVDALRLQQVLSNLLSNAAKFAPRGTEVTLSWECADEHVRVSVRDLGSGVPLEFHERIFSKFSQADSSDQREQGGTGLGLAISKKLIELMHGRIGFISEPGTGKGTTFWFELPVVASVSQKATTMPHLTNQEQRPRILHVEDDADVRAVIAAQAASLADFDGAGNLAEARQRLQSHTYQLLMLDIELPDGSGLDLLHEVQNSQPELPVIILSTNEFSDGQLTMAQAAITKSRYSQTELLNLLRQHLQNQQGKPDGKL